LDVFGYGDPKELKFFDHKGTPKKAQNIDFSKMAPNRLLFCTRWFLGMGNTNPNEFKNFASGSPLPEEYPPKSFKNRLSGEKSMAYIEKT
jgi:hypothetical protein